MVFCLAACGGEKEEPAGNETKEPMKVGMVCIGNPEAAYDRNFINAANAATAILAKEGIDIEWVYSYNHPVDDDQVTIDNESLANDEGCKIVFNNSYGQEEYMVKAAAECPDTHFVGCTSVVSAVDDLDNTSNAFARIYEGRYLAGVAAGLKLNQLIEAGTITPEEAVIGYVGAFHFAEVISGYTSFFLGARSVCPSATMVVQFIGSWGNLQDEANAATSLIENYHAVLISQHSDTTSPATVSEEKGVFHIGYNADMSAEAPNASILSPRIDWTNFFVYAIRQVYNGEAVDPDFCQGLSEGMVALSEINEKAAAPGTAEKLEEVAAQIKSGDLKVFDTSTFTVGGETVTEAFALDTDGDWVPDSLNYIIDGYAHESEFQSAPYFALDIDGITPLL